MAHLLNRKETRKYILQRVEAERTGWNCTRVSQQALDNLEYRLMRIIKNAVNAHPTIGRTFKEIG